MRVVKGVVYVAGGRLVTLEMLPGLLKFKKMAFSIAMIII